MEVEDRHLNVMIDLINEVVNTCPPLMYLTEEFRPIDMVFRLSQMILMFEKQISNDTDIRPALQLNQNADTYCLTACAAIEGWLLEYYKYDFVTLNGNKLQNGVEEEIVLTSLMVLRVMYKMRPFMDNRVNQILTNGWKDLHDFDQQLDEKFDTKCLHFMDLLVKQSVSFQTKINAFVQQIHGLNEENKELTEKLRKSEEKSVSNHLYFNHLSLKRITKPEDNNKPEVQSIQRVSPRKTSPEKKSINSSPKTKTKMSSSDHKLSKDSVNLKNKRQTKTEKKSSFDNILSVNEVTDQSIKTRSKAKVLTPSADRKQRVTSVMRRSPRISKSVTKTKGTEKSAKNTFTEIRAIFSESDESEFEYFDPKQSTKQLPEPLDLHSISPTISRKTELKTKQKVKMNSSVNTLTTNKTQTKTANKFWPSRSKNYPRKKRYPCDWDRCEYIADRPSTLVRHRRAHTGEKPFGCDWPGCTKRYKMSSNLTPHRLTHTGTKPYVCDHCGKRFTYPQHLKRHRISHQKKKFGNE